MGILQSVRAIVYDKNRACVRLFFSSGRRPASGIQIQHYRCVDSGLRLQYGAHFIKKRSNSFFKHFEFLYEINCFFLN